MLFIQLEKPLNSTATKKMDIFGAAFHVQRPQFVSSVQPASF
jgi:hypothetical protein